MIDDAIEKFGIGSTSGPKNQRTDIVRRVTKEEFEEHLFDGGVYHFDFYRDAKELQMDLKDTKAWYDKNLDKKKAADNISIDITDARYELAWRRQYDGKIPERWRNWKNISTDFQEAGKSGLQLSDVLIDAGITYPSPHIAKDVGTSQKLNMTQLVAVMSRHGLPSWSVDEIINAQKTMGLTQKVLNEVQRRADDVKHHVRTV